MRTAYKYLFLTILLVSVISYFIWQQWPDSYFHFIACDVGQADALLITMGFLQVLIDTGKDGAVISCLSEHLPFWDRTIEIVMITHADRDHIGGLEQVLTAYHVEKLFLNPTPQLSISQLQTYFLLSGQFHTLTMGERIVLSNSVGVIDFSVVWPHRCSLSFLDEQQSFWIVKKEHEADRTRNEMLLSSQLCSILEENNKSVSGVLSFLEMSILLTGDINDQIEQAIVSDNVLGSIDVIKIAHHGSKTSTSSRLLHAIQPETAVISVGKNNSYGHPHSSVLDRLDSLHIKVLLTSVLGNVHIVSDGNHYWMKK